MFLTKIDKIFKELPNVLEFADVLVVGQNDNDRDTDTILMRVLIICTEMKLNLNKYKCHFRCSSVPFLSKIISRHVMQPDARKLKALKRMPPPTTKKDLQAFLGIIKYLSKLSPRTAEVCISEVFTSLKTEWRQNANYQKLFNRVKLIIKEDTCMKLYNETKLLYCKHMHPV